jgi:hypothetical protein
MKGTTASLFLAMTVAWAPGMAHAFTYIQVDPAGPVGAWGKAVGDLDGDGRDDLVVSGHDAADPGVYWYQNPGWAKQTVSRTARIATDLEVVDLDKDSRRDIVATGVNSLIWFENKGGTWAARTIASGRVLHDIEVKDLDGDRKLDIVGRNQGASGDLLHLWRQESPTSWSYGTIRLPEGGEGLLATDLDRDGKVDIAIGKYWFRNTSVAGSLRFTRYTYNAAASKDAYIAAGTIDGDGYVDLVVSPAEPAGTRYRVSWFKAPAKPTTGIWAEHVIENDVEAVVHFVGVADFNRDGRSDVATAMMQQGKNPKIKVYYNRYGNGDFGPPTIVANTSSHNMKIVDVNKNGYPDLFGADWDRSPRTPIKLWRQ